MQDWRRDVDSDIWLDLSSQGDFTLWDGAVRLVTSSLTTPGGAGFTSMGDATCAWGSQLCGSHLEILKIFSLNFLCCK